MKKLSFSLLTVAATSSGWAQTQTPTTTATTAQTLVISGTGPSFPAQVYGQWAGRCAQDTGVKINYTASGSSAVVKAYKVARPT